MEKVGNNVTKMPRKENLTNDLMSEQMIRNLRQLILIMRSHLKKFYSYKVYHLKAQKVEVGENAGFLI